MTRTPSSGPPPARANAGFIPDLIHARLASALGSSFAGLAPHLALVSIRHDLQPAGAVLTAERVRFLIETAWRGHRRGRPAEMASRWVRAYLRVLLPGVVAPAFAGIRTDGSARNCLLALHSGQPVALAFAEPPPLNARVNVEGIYGPLLADHAERAVRTVYAATGLSPRAAWTHAAEVLDDLFGWFGAMPALSMTIQAHRLAVLGLPANGWFPVNNPLYRCR